MGKSQYKKKTQGRRHNPIRVPDAHLGAGKGENAAKEKEMLPILNKVSRPIGRRPVPVSHRRVSADSGYSLNHLNMRTEHGLAQLYATSSRMILRQGDSFSVGMSLASSLKGYLTLWRKLSWKLQGL